MRIAMVGPFGLRPKGTMRVRAVPLAQALAAQGHEILVTMPAWHTPEEAPRRWQEQGIWLEYVSLAPRIPVMGELAIALRLLRHALRWQPDVVHCFKPKAYAGLVAWFLWHAQRLGLYQGRLVVDEDDWEGHGGWNDLETYSPIHRAFFAWQERWGLAHCDAVTVASLTLQSLTWAQGVDPARVTYLPNGTFPRSKGARSQLGEQLALGDAPVVLLYTRFFEYDVAQVVEVLARVIEARPESYLLVVGQGLYAKDEQRFDDLVNQAGLGAHVIKTGWVRIEDLNELFAAADVAIYPFDDTLINRTKCSVKLVDLLASGVPVVADCVGQNAAYITHNRTGLLCTSGDSAEMAEYVINLLEDQPWGRRLGAAAAHCMVTEYHWHTLASRALAAYSSSSSTD